MLKRSVFGFALMVAGCLLAISGRPLLAQQSATPVPTVQPTLPPLATPASAQPAAAANPDPERPSLTVRMTRSARYAAHNSPFHKTTWVTYYGRPGVEVMGILGEFPIEELVPLLQQQADAYDEANGPHIGVEPAFHLVFGMATKAPGDNGSHLAYIREELVLEYIEAAAEHDMSVILDIQIGNLSPAEALAVGLPYLQYPNVHLALDPEFAMSHPEQERPGLPIGFVTTSQLNEAQALMRDYLRENKIRGRRILVVHQFMESMIVNDGRPLDRIYKIDLAMTADGFGGPWPKIGKYNQFMTPQVEFAGFKLFYRWDEPLLTERQVLGIDRYPDIDYMNVTPNLIIYQ